MHMDSMEFIAALMSFYKGQDPDKKRAYQNSLSYFADSCPEIHLKDVYQYALTEKFKDAGKLTKFAVEQGYIKQPEKFAKKRAKYYYKCNGFFKRVCVGKNKEGIEIFERKKFNCNTRFSANSGACPNCGSTSACVIIDEKEVGFPEDVKIVQSKCYICSRYSLEIKDREPFIHGPECSTHGNYNSPEGVEYCRSCRCKDCCIDSREEKYNQDNYYYDKNGDNRDIEQAWLKNSRSPGAHIFNFNKLTLNKKSIIKGI